MFRHILVPLDGSARAEQALSVAARLARASSGTVTLLQVVDLAHHTFFSGLGGASSTEGSIEAKLARARDYLEQVRQRSVLAGIRVQTQVGEGDPAAVIIDEAAKSPRDLIVISSHGYTGVKRWIMGSVVEKVASHALVPVLILREGEPLRTHRSLDGTAYVRALVPLDTSPRSQDVLVPAAELIVALSTSGQGELSLTQMVKAPRPANVTEVEAMLQKAEQNLTAIGQSVRDGLVAHFGPELHPILSWSVSLTNDIADGILRKAENTGESVEPGKTTRCDLIAMTTHGAGGGDKWPVGSITQRVLHTTRLPILVVRPTDMIVKERWQRESQTEAAHSS